MILDQSMTLYSYLAYDFAHRFYQIPHIGLDHSQALDVVADAWNHLSNDVLLVAFVCDESILILVIILQTRMLDVDVVA